MFDVIGDPAFLVRRDRLVEQLRRAAQRPLTLVLAPSGYGKTVAVQQFLDATGIRAATVVGEPDDDRTAGWHKVVAALRAADIESGALADVPSLASGDDQIAVLTTVLECASQIVEPTLVVLEDLHRIHDLSLFRHLEMLVERLPPLLRLVAVARHGLPLPTTLWHAQGRMTEIGPDDLQFRPEEAAELFTLRGNALPRAAVQLFNLRAEGWPVAVHLLAAGGRAPGPGQPFDDQSMRRLVDYVLADQPVEIQEFVLTTAVLGRFTPGLCRAVTGHEDAGRLLQATRRANLFVTATSAEPGHADRPGGLDEWFRYRALFAELMRWELEQRRPGASAELHRRAAAWHEEVGEPGEALGHLVTAGLVDRALALANDERYGEWRDDPFLAMDWASAFSTEWLGDDPARMITFAMLLGRSGRLDQARRWIARVEEAMATRPPDDPGHAALRAVRALWHGVHLDVRQCSEGVLAVLPTLEADPGLDVLRQRLLVASCNCHMLVDDLDGAEQAADALVQLRPTELTHDLVGPGLRARLCLRQGHLRRAEALSRLVFRGAEKLHLQSHPAVRDAERALGAVLAERGRHDEAAAMFARAAESALARAWPVVATVVRLEAIELGAVPGGGRAALQELDRERQPLRDLAVGSDLLVRFDAVEARLRIAAGELDRADRLLGGLPPGRQRSLLAVRASLARHDSRAAADRLVGVSSPTLRDRVVVALLAARVAALQDRPGWRDQHLATAARLAAPEALVAIFRREVPELLGRLRELGGHETAAATVAAALDAAPDAPQAQLTGEHLTDRELVVLRRLPGRLTNVEIASELEISPNTLKSHVRSLYRKLGVGSRPEAVAAARRVGLL